MKLDRVTIQGFRGFNSERSFDFHDKLTLVSAANSYGKTSLTEALEFLLYGQTSKVGSASYKDEYKDSYINRHYPSDATAFVEAVLSDGDVHTTLRVNLSSDGSAQRLLDGVPVTDWPFAAALATTARPFVVQHALKELLLSAPVDRFESFARLGCAVVGFQSCRQLSGEFVEGAVFDRRQRRRARFTERTERDDVRRDRRHFLEVVGRVHLRFLIG